MELTSSLEDYLETILVLQNRKPEVRSVDVAEYLNFSKPSIHRAVRLLKGIDYITVDSTGLLHLTKVGMEAAKKVYERHLFFTEQLKSWGIDEKTAEKEACRMEHTISQKSFELIQDRYRKLTKNIKK